MTRYHLLDGEHDAALVAERVGHEIARLNIDVAFVGIGENGHLAFTILRPTSRPNART